MRRSAGYEEGKPGESWVPRTDDNGIVHQLVATDRTIEKLGARTISFEEATQVSSNRHVFLPNPRDLQRRRFLIGVTEGGPRADARGRGDGRADDLATRDWLERDARRA